MESKLVFLMTRKQALENDLLVCKCGHRENNHFTGDGCPCAQCDCNKYTELPRVGVVYVLY